MVMLSEHFQCGKVHKVLTDVRVPLGTQLEVSPQYIEFLSFKGQRVKDERKKCTWNDFFVLHLIQHSSFLCPLGVV